MLENNTHDAVITKPKVQQKLGHQVLKRNSSTNGLREPSEVETTLEMDEEEPDFGSLTGAASKKRTREELNLHKLLSSVAQQQCKPAPLGN